MKSRWLHIVSFIRFSHLSRLESKRVHAQRMTFSSGAHFVKLLIGSRFPFHNSSRLRARRIVRRVTRLMTMCFRRIDPQNGVCALPDDVEDALGVVIAIDHPSILGNEVLRCGAELVGRQSGPVSLVVHTVEFQMCVAESLRNGTRSGRLP